MSPFKPGTHGDVSDGNGWGQWEKFRGKSIDFF